MLKLEWVDALELVHPFTKGFDQVYHCLTEDESKAVAVGDVSDVVAKHKAEDMEGVAGAHSVYVTTFFIGLALRAKPGASTPVASSGYGVGFA